MSEEHNLEETLRDKPGDHNVQFLTASLAREGMILEALFQTNMLQELKMQGWIWKELQRSSQQSHSGCLRDLLMTPLLASSSLLDDASSHLLGG